ncbi:ribonuclease, T2 family [Legionella birminghamensis]|uniref:Ribonuclease, T2 family n=1 Tax=Legionella birminghamensis TaxID=28083 RepID=A0A378I6T4_9GAMM|nr:ribonuclease T [Legionella birminghamensis]KTC70241.1 ribonuclease, T2 family [Legionella birminghamensis]STX30351.1 ribonuclease, T2 family [Legionella birminghamensis]
MPKWISCFFLCFYSSITMAAAASGSFTLEKTCPAYVSKNKKTNPDNVYLQPGQVYEIREINRESNPDWFRVYVSDSSAPLRWISMDCGEASYHTTPSPRCDQSPGLADSFVLAFSWQPAFCQTYGYEAGKPECLHLPARSYQASHLVLHGLWPNQVQCGEHYGFCGTTPRSSHCDYPPLNLNATVSASLKYFMPSYSHGSCLERHEWNKHGSCQLLSADEYFALAIRLTEDMDETALGKFLHDHVGESVNRVDLQEMVRSSFGKDSTRKVYLGCKNGMLVDIFVQLPALITAQESLAELVERAPEASRYEGCPAKVGISDFNSEAWY